MPARGVRRAIPSQGEPGSPSCETLRRGRSTSHRYFGLVVPFAVTMNVELFCTLPFTAKATSVTQCILAPVSLIKPTSPAGGPLALVLAG
eukprot:4933089-Pleurochrysis_carterae.AAC.1